MKPTITPGSPSARVASNIIDTGSSGEYARFLAEKGEGVHHVAVATPNFEDRCASDRGNGVILSGEFGGARVAYLGTDRDLGVIIEIFSGTPDDRPQPDESDP